MVNHKYQGKGIASNLDKDDKNKYKDYLYIELNACIEKKNVSFYQKLGFNIVKEGTPMQLCNPETMKVKL